MLRKKSFEVWPWSQAEKLWWSRKRVKEPQTFVSMSSLFWSQLQYSLYILSQSRVDCPYCVWRGKMGERPAWYWPALHREPGSLWSGPIWDYCSPAFPHGGLTACRPFLGWPPMTLLGEAGQMHGGGDFGTLHMSVLVFAPCPGGFPSARECTEHPRLAHMKLNPATQLHNSFLSDQVRSHLGVQTHMTPPHFQQEEITLPSASWDLINQINVSQQWWIGPPVLAQHCRAGLEFRCPQTAAMRSHLLVPWPRKATILLLYDWWASWWWVHAMLKETK